MPPFMWSLGMIIGAAMGGFLAEPAHYYPSFFSPDGLFGKYPYLLPNLVAVGFILVAIIQGYFFLEETNPRFQSRSRHTEDNDSGPVDEYTPLRPNARRNSATEILSTGHRRPSFISGSMPTMNEPSFNLRKGSVTTLHEIRPVISRSEPVPDHDASEPPIKAFNRSVITWTVALVIMCYHQMAFGSLLPIYLLDEPHKSRSLDLRGGLGYTVHDVGAFMSVNGIIALVIQATIFPVFVGRVGVWKSLVSLLILCPITYIIVPFLGFLPRSGLPIGIYAVLTLENFFLIIIYPCLLIALKNATPSSLVLGKVNGLAMSACSGARTVAPPLAGIIYSAGGSAVAWWSIAAVAAAGALELCWIARPKDDADVVVENVLRRKSTVESPVGRLHEEEEG
jgi:MFS family permease